MFDSFEVRTLKFVSTRVRLLNVRFDSSLKKVGSNASLNLFPKKQKKYLLLFQLRRFFYCYSKLDSGMKTVSGVLFAQAAGGTRCSCGARLRHPPPRPLLRLRGPGAGLPRRPRHGAGEGAGGEAGAQVRRAEEGEQGEEDIEFATKAKIIDQAEVEWQMRGLQQLHAALVVDF